MKEIENGYCHCGCGLETTPYQRSNSRLGIRKGEPNRYVKGHENISPRDPVLFDFYLGEECAFVPLTRGKWAIVNIESLPRLTGKWHITVDGYAAQGKPKGDKRTIVRMHRYLMNCPDDMDVDHRNGDGLDNRTSNLRVVTASQNMMNQRPQVGKSSIYKGVSLHKATGRWAASIKINSRKIHLGFVADEIEAAKLYDMAATLEFKEYARTNF